MDTQEVNAVLTDVFRTLFRRDDLELRDEMTAKDVAGWDSLNHVNLIIQIEEELGIKFRNDEVARLVDVGERKALVQQKVARTAG
jgi:acyl carrier protein